MLLVLVIFLLIVVVFAVQNAQMVPINFLAWSFSSNQALIVLGSLAIGLLVGALWSWFKGASQRRLLKETTKSLDEAQRRIVSLENSLSEEIAKTKVAEMEKPRPYEEAKEAKGEREFYSKG